MLKRFFAGFVESGVSDEERLLGVREFGEQLQDDQEYKRQVEILELKRKQAIEQMGEKWILHPAHMIKKKEKVAA